MAERDSAPAGGTGRPTAGGGHGSGDADRGWEWLEAVLQAIEQPVIAIDGSDRSVVLFNAAAERQLGYSADEVIGRNVSMLMIPPHREEHDGYIERYVTTGEAHIMGGAMNVQVQRKDGVTFPAQLTLSEAIVGGRRSFLGTIVKLGEDAAEDRTTLPDDTLSKISHDLRTPLNVILGFGQVLQMEPLNAHQAEAVGYIIEAGRQLQVLLDEGLERVRATLASQPAITTSPQPRDGGGAGDSRVLCIEDSVENVELLKAVVRRLPGVELESVRGGREGIEAARRNPPRVVILDLHLPDMDGEEVLKVFKDEPPLQECFVVVVSGDVGEDRVESLKAAGAHSFVAKPLDVKRLLSLMRELLGRPSGD